MTYLNCNSCPEAAALEIFAIDYTKEYWSDNKKELKDLTEQEQLERIYYDFLAQLKLDPLKIAIEYTINKLKNENTDSSTSDNENEDPISDDEEEADNEGNHPLIYCYIEQDWDEEEDYYILGLMNSFNHGWDTDCFHTIHCDKSFSSSVSKIHDILKSNNISNRVNQDSGNWRYSITGAEIHKAKKLLREIELI